MNLTKTHKILIAVVIIAVISYFLLSKGKRENFAAESVLEQKRVEPKIVPQYVNQETGTIMGGSEFVGLPEYIYPATGENAVNNYGKMDKLDDGYNGAMGLNFNVCSKSCCSAQYPPSFKLPTDPFVEKNKDKFVPNSFMCNNAWQDTGCVCMTQKQRDYLTKRGTM